jgi:hypothetical protein
MCPAPQFQVAQIFNLLYRRFLICSTLKWLALLLGTTLLQIRAPAETISENFASDPFSRGWSIFGDTNLFHWRMLEQNLAVTWDSSRPNSYFYRPLGTILARDDTFALAFDLELFDVAGGVNPNKPSTFQLAIGFLNLVHATRTNFFRGNGFFSPNLVEFDFFPDTGFGPTVWPAIWSTNSSLNYNGPGDYAILNLPLGVPMRVTMTFSNQILLTCITTNGVGLAPCLAVPLSPTFTDFRVGCFAVESFNDAGQDPQYGGSLLAHGVVDNILISVPPPPVSALAARQINSKWQVDFVSRSNWIYQVERSTNLLGWAPLAGPVVGGGPRSVPDTNSASVRAFYRVNAFRP